MEGPIIGFDVDGTLGNWTTSAALGYPAMANKLAEITGKDVGEARAAMRRFYTTSGTMENEGLVQALNAQGFFKDVPNFDQENAIAQVKASFDRVREDHLHLYPGRLQLLQDLVAAQVPIIAFSDAPMSQLMRRLHVFGITHLFGHILGQQPAQVENLPEDRNFDLQTALRQFPNHKILDREKPHANLGAALGLTAEQIHSRLIHIGDSDPRDMGFVRMNNCRGIHVQEDNAIELQNHLDTLAHFAPPHASSRSTPLSSEKPVQAATSNPRIVTAKNTDEIRAALREWSVSF